MARALSANIGDRFGRLTVIDNSPELRLNGRHVFGVQCDCGKRRLVQRARLFSGDTRSCGCLRGEMLAERTRRRCSTHGLSNTATFVAWVGMRRRCQSPTSKNWPEYGGRGIRVCERWGGRDCFANFLADMGERPSRLHTIDRIDVNGNYEPGNCRWATRTEQNRNMRRTLLSLEAVERLRTGDLSGVTPAEAAEALGISRSLVYSVRSGRAWKAA